MPVLYKHDMIHDKLELTKSDVYASCQVKIMCSTALANIPTICCFLGKKLLVLAGNHFQHFNIACSEKWIIMTNTMLAIVHVYLRMLQRVQQ